MDAENQAGPLREEQQMLLTTVPILQSHSLLWKQFYLWRGRYGLGTILNLAHLLKHAAGLQAEVEISEAADSEAGDGDILLPCSFETVAPPVIG